MEALNLTTEIQESLKQVFSPARPIDDAQAFYGRYEEINRLSETIDEAGMHITLYGERGIGKTSLANVVLKKKPHVHSIKITCSANIGFTNLWRDVIQTLSTELPEKAFLPPKQPPSASEKKTRTPTPSLELFRTKAKSLLKDTEHKALSLEKLINLLNLVQTPLVIVFDEFDLAVKQETMSALFASAIKTFSDRLTQVTLVLVGIANSGQELIGEHPSLERCLSQILLQRMQAEEMKQFIESSLSKINLTIHPEVETLLLELAAGFPYFMHMLGKYAAESAFRHRYTVITKVNLKESTQKAIRHMFESISTAYIKAIRPSPTLPPKARHLHAALLEAAAGFKPDPNEMNLSSHFHQEEETRFCIQDLLPFINIKAVAFEAQSDQYLKKVALALSQFTQKGRGQVLEKLPKTMPGEPNYYRFRNPLLKAYSLLKLYLK